jgi:hypothetical protein
MQRRILTVRLGSLPFVGVGMSAGAAPSQLPDEPPMRVSVPAPRRQIRHNSRKTRTNIAAIRRMACATILGDRAGQTRGRRYRNVKASRVGTMAIRERELVG